MLDTNIQTRIEKLAAVFHYDVCNVSSVDLGPDAKLQQCLGWLWGANPP